MRIEVGLGLEKILTNEICKQIIDQKMAPILRKRNFSMVLTKPYGR